jgi:hypothetical protein
LDIINFFYLSLNHIISCYYFPLWQVFVTWDKRLYPTKTWNSKVFHYLAIHCGCWTKSTFLSIYNFLFDKYQSINIKSWVEISLLIFFLANKNKYIVHKSYLSDSCEHNPVIRNITLYYIRKSWDLNQNFLFIHFKEWISSHWII